MSDLTQLNPHLIFAVSKKCFLKNKLVKKGCVIAILHGEKLVKKSLFLSKTLFFQQFEQNPTVVGWSKTLKNDGNAGFPLYIGHGNHKFCKQFGTKSRN